MARTKEHTAATLEREIDAKRARVAVIEDDKLIAEGAAEALRADIGRLVADGKVWSEKRTSLREVEDTIDGCVRALELLGADIARMETQRRELTMAEARERFLTLRDAAYALMAELDERVRAA